MEETSSGQLRARRTLQPQQRRGQEMTTRNGTLPSDSDANAKHSRDELGFRHWLFVLLLVAGLYGAVVWQGQRMPDVRPADQNGNFSEMRAREMLDKITRLGPRPSGSEALEMHAFKLIWDKIGEFKGVADRQGVNRLELDVQRPSGCFDLKFLSIFTLCYHKVTNIVARIGPRRGPSDFSILLNCHFDTLPDTPGATDDAVSCAIMLDVLHVLAHSKEALEQDIVFLFNGAEENFLQASHGFITEHPWRHSIRAFINLEGSGSGGRELLFQSGPGESWLIKTYLDNAPHPHCSVLGQEIFQLGVIPSDTDFRMFRDYGRISGFDIAYIRNGWVYHTEFDRPELIESGAIQRSGENILAVSRALIRSPYLKQPANFDEGTKWVFFDVVGMFTVFYEMSTALVLNYSTLAVVLLHVACRLRNRDYSLRGLLRAFVNQFLALLAMLATGLGLVGLVSALSLHMAWFAMPELVFPLYILPMLTAALWTHSRLAARVDRGRREGAEKAQFDSTIVLWAAVLLLLSVLQAASSFFFLLHVSFPLLRDPLIAALRAMGLVKRRTPQLLFWLQSLCLVPLVVVICSYTQLLFDFFVPVMGRFGNAINPELVMMPFSLVVSLTIVMFTNNLVYVSRKLTFMLRCLVAVSALGFLVIASTSLGVPFKYSEQSPRLRRVIALHSKREVFSFDGSLAKADTGLFVQALDYRGPEDLPEHTFLQGVGPPNCSGTLDEYCQLPYYTAIHELFPPDQSRWVPLPVEPPIERPLEVRLLGREEQGERLVNLSIVVRGGADKMSLHITPLGGHQLSQWSFTPFNPRNYGVRPRSTYFVFMTYGHEAPEERRIWIQLERGSADSREEKQGKEPVLEFAVATHYAHGKSQNSDTLLQLRSIISSRRRTPHAGVGFWRWAITLIGGTAEIVVRLF